MELIEHRGPRHRGGCRPPRHAAGLLLVVFLLSGLAGWKIRSKLRS